jgi:hypothetical protein
MVTRSSTTFIAGLVVVCLSVQLSMVPSGSGITSNTISLSWANKRKPLALPRSRFSVSSYFPHFDLFGSTSARSSFISSTCLCVRVSRDMLISRCGQRTELHFVLRYDMLTYTVAMEAGKQVSTSSFASSLRGASSSHTPLPLPMHHPPYHAWPIAPLSSAPGWQAIGPGRYTTMHLWSKDASLLRTTKR